MDAVNIKGFVSKGDHELTYRITIDLGGEELPFICSYNKNLGFFKEGDHKNMFLSLREKVDYEFNKFQCEKVRQTKESIFASSYEIEVKKAVYRILCQEPFTKKESELLIRVQNLIDMIFAEMEKNRLCGDKNIKKCISGILNAPAG